MDTIETKKCTGECGEIKSMDCFYKGRNVCKSCRSKSDKKYRLVNSDKIKKTQKKWRDKNKESEKKRGEKWKVENPEYFKNYGENNKKRRNKKRKDRRLKDGVYKSMGNICSSFKRWIKNNKLNKNNKPTFNCLLYTIEEFKVHIELLFESWMTWDNQGSYSKKHWDDNDPATWKWQIDHIIPQSTFIITSMDDIENIQKCWALSNLRPLSAKQNLLDGATKIRHKKERE